MPVHPLTCLKSGVLNMQTSYSIVLRVSVTVVIFFRWRMGCILAMRCNLQLQSMRNLLGLLFLSYGSGKGFCVFVAQK